VAPARQRGRLCVVSEEATRKHYITPSNWRLRQARWRPDPAATSDRFGHIHAQPEVQQTKFCHRRRSILADHRGRVGSARAAAKTGCLFLFGSIVPEKKTPGLVGQPWGIFARGSSPSLLRGRHLHSLGRVALGGSDLSSVRDRTNVIFLHHPAPKLAFSSSEKKIVAQRERPSRSGARTVDRLYRLIAIYGILFARKRRSS